MRCANMLMVAVLLAAVAWGVGSGPAAGVEPETGPVLLELNPPLLLAADPATGPALGGDGEATEDKTPSQPQSAAADEKTARAETKPDEPPAKPELSDQMKTLREAVRRTIAAYGDQPFNTRENTPTNVLEVCTAFGCDSYIHREGPSGPKISAFTCLCWNEPCAGRELLRVADGQVWAKVGYGLQEYPAQFLAAMALSRVPVEFPLHIGKDVRAVSDLVEGEKRNCRSGEESSFRLIGLARYVPSDATWQNDAGETWSVARLLEEELKRPAEMAPAGGVYRLLALSYVLDRRAKRGEPIDGPYEQAQKYLNEFSKYALELQNADGSWHPEFFAYRGQGGDVVAQLRSTGQILRWLAFSLPEEQLQDPHMVRGIEFLVNNLDTRRYRTYLQATSNREIAARMGAVHALVLYNQRRFVPFDEPEKPAEEKGETKKESVAGTGTDRR